MLLLLFAAAPAAHTLAGDSFQLVWVTSHAELLKEAEAEGFHEPQGLGQVGGGRAASCP